MYWVPDPDHPPFVRIDVDAQLCIGCKKCPPVYLLTSSKE